MYRSRSQHVTHALRTCSLKQYYNIHVLHNMNGHIINLFLTKQLWKLYCAVVKCTVIGFSSDCCLINKTNETKQIQE